MTDMNKSVWNFLGGLLWDTASIMRIVAIGLIVLIVGLIICIVDGLLNPS